MPKPKIGKDKKNKLNFQEADASISRGIAHVDGLLEKIRQNSVKVFSFNHIDQLRKLSKPELKQLNVKCIRTADEMKQAINGDEFFEEAYSHFTKPQLKLILEFFKNIHSLKPDEHINGRKIRLGKGGGRRKKEKQPEEIIAKVLYLPRDQETGVTGLSPIQCLGASEMWIYNTKTRKMGCYYASSSEGLSVKGTTILNYDEKRSMTKTLRWPKEQLQKALNGENLFQQTDTWIWEYWNSIRAVPQEISPRLNRETLILQVSKD